MGRFLADGLTERMIVIGYATGRGSYGAWGERDVAEFPLKSPPDSIEAALLAAESPRFLLDLRSDPESEGIKWLSEPRLHGLLGRRAVARDYDILAWIEETSPSVRLPTPKTP
jgi:erythromycin esterase-like protein